MALSWKTILLMLVFHALKTCSFCETLWIPTVRLSVDPKASMRQGRQWGNGNLFWSKCIIFPGMFVCKYFSVCKHWEDLDKKQGIFWSVLLKPQDADSPWERQNSLQTSSLDGSYALAKKQCIFSSRGVELMIETVAAFCLAHHFWLFSTPRVGLNGHVFLIIHSKERHERWSLKFCKSNWLNLMRIPRSLFFRLCRSCHYSFFS